MREWLQQKTVSSWQRRVTVACWAHQQLTDRYRAGARALNVIIVAMNAVIGSAVFASLLDSAVSYPLRIGAGMFSMIVAIVAAVKSELNFDGLHEQHRLAHRGYDRLKQKLETNRTVRFVPPLSANGELHSDWAEIQEEVSTLNSDAPTIPEWLRDQLEKRYNAAMELERHAMEEELQIFGGYPMPMYGTHVTGAAATASRSSGKACRRITCVPPAPVTGGVTPQYGRRAWSDLEMIEGGGAGGEEGSSHYCSGLEGACAVHGAFQPGALQTCTESSAEDRRATPPLPRRAAPDASRYMC